MIEETISRIEERLRRADWLPAAERAELEELLAQLRRETQSLPIESGRNEIKTDEEDVQGALNRLEQSLTEFETTHPQLTGLVNRISTILANMGI